MLDIKTDRIIGIVGGMGPRAGIELMNSILQHTSAVTDQQHLSTVLMSLPRYIVDRSFYLEGFTNENPAIVILDIIRKLEAVGAEIIGLACNTSHSPAIYDVIVSELERTRSRVQLVNMAEEVCSCIRHHAGLKKIGLMVTNGTYKSGLYERMLRNMGYEVVLPDYEFQNDVIHRMIYDPDFGIKSNPVGITPEVRLLLKKAIHFFQQHATEALVLGCTELSLVGREEFRNMLLFDSTEIFARALIREATVEETVSGMPRNIKVL